MTPRQDPFFAGSLELARGHEGSSSKGKGEPNHAVRPPPSPPTAWSVGVCRAGAGAGAACGLCMPQKNERPSGSPTYLCRKKTSAPFNGAGM